MAVPRRLVGASAVIAASCGLVVGPLVFVEVPVGARLFFGGSLGLLVGGIIGAIAALAGLAVAAVARSAGLRGVRSERITFVTAGSLTALVAARAALPPMSSLTDFWISVCLAVVTVSAGTVLGCRYIRK